MTRLVRCSWGLSVIALLAFVLLLCRNAGWLPDGTLIPLRVAAVGTSAVAGLFGLVVCLGLDFRGRTRAALAVGGLACVAGLPALSILVHLLIPTD